MIIDKYDIRLETLNSETAELVRVWRNDPEISRFMDFKDHISAEQQKLWLKKIQSDKTAYYFLIRKDNIPIGLIHLDSIDKTQKTANVGLFLGNKDFQGTGVVFAGSIVLLDFAFEELGLAKVFAKVNNGNVQAIGYNSFLGFTVFKALNNNFTQWKLSFEEFELKKHQVLRFLGVNS